MEHQDFQELLEEYAKGNLPEKTQADVYSHVIGCASCQAELKFLENYFGAVEKMEQPLPSPDFLAKVHKRIEKLPQKKIQAAAEKIKRPFWNWRVIGLISTCLVIVSVLIVHQNQLPKSEMAFEKKSEQSNAPKATAQSEKTDASQAYPIPKENQAQQDIFAKNKEGNSRKESLNDVKEPLQKQILPKLEEDKNTGAMLRKAAPKKSESYQDAREAGRMAAERMAKDKAYNEIAKLKEEAEEIPLQGFAKSKPINEAPENKALVMESAPKSSPDVSEEPQPSTMAASAPEEADEEMEMDFESIAAAPPAPQKMERAVISTNEKQTKASKPAEKKKSKIKLAWPEKHWVWTLSRKDSSKIDLNDVLQVIEGYWDSHIFNKKPGELDFYIPRDQIRPLIKGLIISGYQLKENNQAHQLEKIYIRLRF